MSLPGDRVCAVIVHYRTPAETERAARAVAEASPGTQILVVDNASVDRIAEALVGPVPSARVVTEAVNRGYGAGVQPRCAGDVAPVPAVPQLRRLRRVRARSRRSVAALDADPRAAAAGPRLLSADGSLQPSIRRLPTPWRIFCESSGLAFLSGGRRPLSGHTATRQDHSAPRAVEALMGAALLVRRSAFEEAGGFDESFFLYAEETDLMARWRRAGWRLLYEPAARVRARGRAFRRRPTVRAASCLARRATAGKHHGAAAGRFVAANAALAGAPPCATPRRS